jgi:sugar/nucleoside kinase (ribokinase family)
MAIRLFDVRAVGASFDVCAIGNAIVDIIADSDDAFLSVHEIAKGSMTLIDEERADFLYARIGPAVETSGGSAANTAAGIAAFGGTPTYIGKVKDDQFGKIFRHDLKTLGVHFATPPLSEGPATARCLILVTPDAQRSMNTYLGACVELTVADIDPAPIRGAQITYLEGYLFDKPTAQAAFLEAAKIAHAADRQLALTLSDPFCVERHRGAFQELVQNEVDILLANELELMALYQAPTFEAALKAAREKCKIVVGTRSEKGAVIANNSETIVVSAEPVTHVVDTTGAGDLFAAGFLYGLTHGHDLAVSARLGALASAEVISHYGPRPRRALKEIVKEKGIRI